ncbi:MAG: PDZ domain-containing protein, partial [Lentisphaerae bacterium]|nr:PDZ domain-containing protein [Lentisphaerota bacterium]
DPTDTPHTVDGRELPPGAPKARALTALAGPLANVFFGFFLALFIWWIGIDKPAPATFCDVVDVPEACAEYAAGLRAGDRIVTVDSKALSRGWEELTNAVVLSTGDVTLGVERGGKTLDIVYKPEPNPETEGLGYPFFRVQLPIVVRRTMSGSPAAKAGLQRGDRIVRVNGERLLTTLEFVECVKASKGAPLELLINRGGTEITVADLRAREETVEGEVVHRIGIEFGAFVKMHPNPWQQFVGIFVRTRDTWRSLFSRKSLVKTKHMSGPVGILQIIWIKVASGFIEGLSFVILVSFSLAFFNLLPIPVLDGGHILFALLEAVIRRKIPTRVANALQTAFACALIALMLYITWFDLKRSVRMWRLRKPVVEEQVDAPQEHDVPKTPKTPAPTPADDTEMP